MKKTFISFFALALLLVSVDVWAKQVTVEDAAAIAARFTNENAQLSRAHKAPRQAANMRLAHKALQNDSQDAAFYVFNQEGNKGFVIVSADDRTAEEVLGYSENGSFDFETINPNLRWWLSRYAEEITVLQTIDDSEFIENSARKAKQVTAIPNLLVNRDGKEITWYQEAPYYNLCPMDERDNTRCLTGCVATAASQIMYKWEWPTQGTGSSSYTWYDCLNDACSQYKEKILSANYGETMYDWNNMLPAYEGKNPTTAQKNAVATLMYHAGVAAQMMYGGDATGGSGAWTDDMGYGFVTYFGYKVEKFISMYSKSNYQTAKGTTIAENITCEFNVTSTKMKEYFNADLEAGRPIIMGGEDNGGGHEFVCCGRDANNKFYINWGWEGSGNGYYALTSLRPSGTTYNFSSNMDALIGLEPDVKDLPMITITWSVDGVETTSEIMQSKALVLPEEPEACESGKVFVGWTASDNVEGDAPEDLFTTATGKTVTEEVTYYAVFATATEGEGEGEAAFDGETGGTFKISAQAGETKYYATATVSNNKLQSTTNESEAAEFVLTPVTNGFTIQIAGKYLSNGSKTNVNLSTTAYTWSIEEGTYGTWRVNSSTNQGRALIFRSGDEYNVFGAYATSNLGGNTYYDIEIGGGNGASVTYSDYSLTCGEAPIDPEYFTIGFYTNGELIGEEQTVEEGQLPEVPADPEAECEEYTFFGWFTEVLAADNTVEPVIVTDFTATQDQNYYAIFTKTEESETYYTSIVSCEETVVESIQSSEIRIQKAVRDGQMVIIRGEAVYTITGTHIQ